jgi:hypothetical protein
MAVPVWIALTDAELAAEQNFTQTKARTLKKRDISASEKLGNVGFAEQSTTNGSGSPVTAFDNERIIPVDATKYTFRIDAKSSDGASQVTIRVTVGSDTMNTQFTTTTGYVQKDLELSLTGVGRKQVKVEFWRATGAGTVFVKAPGNISTTWNGESYT